MAGTNPAVVAVFARALTTFSQELWVLRWRLLAALAASESHHRADSEQPAAPHQVSAPL